MKKTFNMGVLIYVLFFMVIYHGYFEKETPVVTVKCASPLIDSLPCLKSTRLKKFPLTFAPPYGHPAARS